MLHFEQRVEPPSMTSSPFPPFNQLLPARVNTGMPARGTSATSGQDTVATLFEGLASAVRLGGTGLYSRRLLGIKRAKESGGFSACGLVFLIDALNLLRDLFFGHGSTTK
jgi:hypothetical protein